MQNPTNGLEKGKWYRIVTPTTLWSGKHKRTGKLTDIPAQSLVCFLSYHPGNTKVIQAIYGEFVGWIDVSGDKSHREYFVVPRGYN